MNTDSSGECKIFLSEEHQAKFYYTAKNISGFEPWRNPQVDSELYVICGDSELWDVFNRVGAKLSYRELTAEFKAAHTPADQSYLLAEFIEAISDPEEMRVSELLAKLKLLNSSNYELAINALHIRLGHYDQVSTYSSSPYMTS